MTPQRKLLLNYKINTHHHEILNHNMLKKKVKTKSENSEKLFKPIDMFNQLLYQKKEI